MRVNNGGPAFPDSNGQMDYTGGMTLRDYFAAKAMQGLINDDYWARDSIEVSKKAYKIADAMIEARGL
jgi:hypothetical protein